MISYFTDGSANPNPGPGGFAVIKDGQPYIIGSELPRTRYRSSRTTNNRMEATALIMALHDAAGRPCTITTDSQLWIDVLTKWAPNWHRNNWVRKNKPIKNLDLVKPLFTLYKRSRAKLVWTRGHVGTRYNEMADFWADEARRRQLPSPIRLRQLPDTNQSN